MSYFAGQTTPLYFTFEDFDLRTADTCIVTFSYGNNILFEQNLGFTGSAEVHSATVRLTQEQSLSLPIGDIKVQFNFIVDDVRIPSEIVTIRVDKNLHMSVIE